MANKRYYWLKLPQDFFQSETMRWLEEQPNGIYYSNFYLKLCLMSINDNGMLIRRVGEMYIPYDVKRLSELTNINQDTIMVAIQLLQKVGLLEILDNGAFYLNQVKNMVGSETESTRRSRKSRENKKLELAGNTRKKQPALQCNKNVTQNATLENRDKSIENRDKSIEIRVVEEENNNSTTTTTTTTEKDFEQIHRMYAAEISRNGLCCSPMETEKIKNLLAEYGTDKVREAIKVAVMRNKRSLGYIEGVLKKINETPTATNNEPETMTTAELEEKLRREGSFKGYPDFDAMYGGKNNE